MGMFLDAISGSAGSGSKSSYGINAEVTINVDDRDIMGALKNVVVSDILVETQTSNKAGICEVRMQSVMPTMKIKELPFPGSEISKIKVGHKLEVLIANSRGSKLSKPGVVFTGFVERLEVEFDKNIFTCIIYGMDAKMWMMVNKHTAERGNKVGYDKVAKEVLGKYGNHAKMGTVELASRVNLKNRCYQVDESDYDFLCRIGSTTGSLFFVDNEGKVNFCSPKKLMSNSEKIKFGDGNVCKIVSRTSVWGTVKSVKVTATDSSDPSKLIEATVNSAKSIGSGKSSSGLVSQNYSSEESGVRCIELYDNSIKSQEEAKALAEAIYAQREAKLTKVEITLYGNWNLNAGKSVELSGFGEPFDGEYLIEKSRHVIGIYSEDGQYYTILTLSSNKSKL